MYEELISSDSEESIIIVGGMEEVIQAEETATTHGGDYCSGNGGCDLVGRDEISG